jgi:adenylate kinase
MNVVFYGPEGSGKGTQAVLVAKELGVPHLVSGDLVRKYAKEDRGIIGEMCREALRKGHYVADSEMYVLWKQRLKEKDTQKGWVLDGFPRNLTQAKFLARKVEKYGHRLDAVFFLDVSREESKKRLVKRGRRSPDGSLHDSPKLIKERLRRYNKGKEAVLRYYRKRGLLIPIDGEHAIESVHKDIMKKIEKIKKRKNKLKGEP